MAKLQIRTWKGSDGKRPKADYYTVILYRNRRRYKVHGYSVNANGKDLSQQLGRTVTSLLDCKGARQHPP